ncbi:MAG: response regulator [Anaerolineales bacterium]|nr:response regulator [Anaerolineales bacterium]
MSRSILVVDDEDVTREILQILLEMEGFTVFAAADGLEALEKVAECRPDLIILDLMMPRLDGLGVCKQLRAQPETADLAIILLSGNSQDRAVTAGLRAGANAYLMKPIDPPLLLSEINKYLNLTLKPS